MMPMLMGGLMSFQFAHYFFEDQWFAAWVFHDLSIICLCAIAWPNVRNGNAQAMIAILGLYVSLSTVTNLSGVYLDQGFWPLIMAFMAFCVWMIKTAFLFKPKSDDFSDKTYMYALAPVKNVLQAGNVLRFGTCALYGGRVLVAGENSYFVHKRRFTKKKTELLDLSEYVFVDTGIDINKEDDNILAERIGEKAIPLINDCSTLSLNKTLGYCLMERAINKFKRV